MNEAEKITTVVPRLRVQCPACQGDGYREVGFASGSNVGISQRCGQCYGSGSVWIDAPKVNA